MKIFAYVAVILLTVTFSDAGARDWNPKPSDVARDYLILQHNLSDREIVMMIWLAPPMVADETEGGPLVKAILADHLVFGFTHLKLNTSGLFDSVKTGDPRIVTVSGQNLDPVGDAVLTPTAKAVVVAMREAFAQNLGVIGQAMEWYTYDGRAVPACTEGGMFVNYNGESYDFTTPIPGCR